jgi:thymidylate synthase (FAD)
MKEVVPLPPEVKLVDVMSGAHRWHSQVSEFGFVDLVDVMPRLIPEGSTVDAAVVQAARVSYGQGTKSVSDDRGLLRYLMRHNHTTPFEMVELKFHCSMPIFVARQWIRHRTANVNENSGRYSIIEDRFYTPTVDDVREQSATNKQGGDRPVDPATAKDFVKWLNGWDVYSGYRDFIAKGIAREQARINLPLSTFTQWYWKIDAWNLIRFLSLRCDHHAQKEIRVYANAMLEMVRELMPLTIEAWNDYHPMRDAVILSRQEVEHLRETISFSGLPLREIEGLGKREQTEWTEKARKLGFGTSSPWE